MDDKFYNVGIYIDYENVYKSLLVQNTNLLRLGFFEKVHEWCGTSNRRIVKIAAYCNFDNKDLYESYHQTKLQEYGVDTIHTSNKGKNFADLQIAIDVLNTMYQNNNIDEFIIMSNDKDMSPLLNTIKLNKRKVTLITIGDKFDQAICNVPDEHVGIEEILKVKIDQLYISREDDQILNNLEKYANDIISTKKKIELSYYINSCVKREHLMEYEIINILKMLYDKGLILLYDYKHYSDFCIGILPASLKDDYISNKIIEIADIKSDFNFDLAIKDSYDKYIHQNP